MYYFAYITLFFVNTGNVGVRRDVLHVLLYNETRWHLVILYNKMGYRYHVLRNGMAFRFWKRVNARKLAGEIFFLFERDFVRIPAFLNICYQLQRAT